MIRSIFTHNILIFRFTATVKLGYFIERLMSCKFLLMIKYEYRLHVAYITELVGRLLTSYLSNWLNTRVWLL